MSTQGLKVRSFSSSAWPCGTRSMLYRSFWLPVRIPHGIIIIISSCSVGNEVGGFLATSEFQDALEYRRERLNRARFPLFDLIVAVQVSPLSTDAHGPSRNANILVPPSQTN